MGYLQMIVRAGSRPILPSRSHGVRHAQVNRASALEKTAHAFVPSVKTQRRFSPANRGPDHQKIRGESVHAAQEGAEHIGVSAEAAISDDHDGRISQNSGVEKAFIVPEPLSPAAQTITEPQPVTVAGNNVPSHLGSDLHPQQKAEQNSPHPEDVVGRSACPGAIVDVPPVIQPPRGEARSIEEEGRQDGVNPVVAIPSARLQPSGTSALDSDRPEEKQGAEQNRPQPGRHSSDTRIPFAREARSIEEEGRQDGVNPVVAIPSARLQPSSPSALDSDRPEEKQGAEQNRPQPGKHSSDTEIPLHTAASVAGSPLPEGVSRPPRRQKAAYDPHMDLSVFYVTPRQTETEASEMPKSTALQSLIGNMEQPKVRTITPEADAGKAAKTIAPAVEDSRPAGETGGHDAIADRLSATKPQGASPRPIREVSPPPHREPEPPAARPRGQTPMPPGAGTGPPHKDEKGPRLLIHRLDVQIVNQQPPEPPCQIPQPQSAATQREAWEGVDRYYLHRLFTGA
jgi:hypothetical protein